MHCPDCRQEFQQRGYRFCPYDGTRLLHESRQKGASTDPLVASNALVGGRYRVRSFVAKGAMARLYAADDEKSGQLVALKLMDTSRVRGAEARERFVRESEAVAGIDHPNVVKILETGESDGTPFLVMEFLAGESLKERLDRDGMVDAQVAVPVLTQAADALWAAHEKGIVHRDVKPDNLFLIGEHPENPGCVRVLDFGLSRLFQSKLTAIGTVIGTPGYMAPEQVVADPVDQRTDVYGLGMVMYRMFTGRLPFDGDEDVVILAKQLLHHPNPPSAFAPVGERVDRVILTAIHKKPENRYPSMQVFANELRKLAHPTAQLWAPEHQWDRYDPTSLVGQQVIGGYRKLLQQRGAPVSGR
jgi:serine/threonine-protein kinase